MNYLTVRECFRYFINAAIPDAHSGRNSETKVSLRKAKADDRLRGEVEAA